MSIKNNRLFPYPIYTSERSDYKDNNFKLKGFFGEETPEIMWLNLEYSIGDSELVNLIKEDKISIVCQIDCPYTKMRESLVLKDLNHVEIPLRVDQINISVSVTCSLTTREDIKDFKDENLSDFYKEVEVNFPKYAKIGFSNTISVKVQKKTEISADPDSIIKVMPTEGKNRLRTFEPQYEYIYVYLPIEQYRLYKSMQGYATRIKMEILEPVLVEVLAEINFGRRDYSDFKWFSVIERILQEKNLLAEGELKEDFTERLLSEISQILLGETLMEDFFNELDDLFNRYEEDDD